MKVFAVLLLVGSVACSPRYYEDSDSYGHFELPLADDDNWQNEVLEYTNVLRNQGSVPFLKLDAELTKDSQKWAEKIACGNGEHDQLDGVKAEAENLAGVNVEPGSDIKKGILGEGGVQQWYLEGLDYDCRSFVITSEYFMKIGHYGNLMNKRFNAVGFGLAMCPGKNRTGWFVARFSGKDDGLSQQMLAEEMSIQNLTPDKLSELDMSAFIPCFNGETTIDAENNEANSEELQIPEEGSLDTLEEEPLQIDNLETI